MEAKFTLDESTYLKHAAALRRHDRGRALDYFTGTVFSVGLLVAFAAYYVFGPNLISHGAVACFIYWFFLRSFLLNALRRRTFKSLPTAGEVQKFGFSQQGFSRTIGSSAAETFKWDQLSRAILDEDGMLMEFAGHCVWLAPDSFESKEDFSKTQDLIQDKVPKAKRR
ncbi:MAG: hypothetical protein KDD66_08565 [Bdellovibrionales bacterium]|nr:hypothetical protein [Bdellovibrionales bacterium]